MIHEMAALQALWALPSGVSETGECLKTLQMNLSVTAIRKPIEKTMPDSMFSILFIIKNLHHVIKAFTGS
jgi:hypothetical protein